MRRSLQQEITEEIRAQILSGELLAGTKLGTTTSLQQKYGVSEIVIRRVIEMLTREGFVTSQRGLGHFVAERQIIRQVTAERYRTPPAGPQTDASTSTPSYRSHRIKAPAAISRRLQLEDGAAVVAIDYVFRDIAGEVTHIAHTYEPVDIVGGTPAELTGSGSETTEHDVFTRMASIGVLVAGDQAVEETQARVVTHEEAEQLGIAPGAAIMHTAATFYDSSGRPVSTTDFLLPGSRFVRVDHMTLGGGSK
jgi:GntR family transcriptional regulator